MAWNQHIVLFTMSLTKTPLIDLSECAQEQGDATDAGITKTLRSSSARKQPEESQVFNSTDWTVSRGVETYMTASCPAKPDCCSNSK